MNLPIFSLSLLLSAPLAARGGETRRADAANLLSYRDPAGVMQPVATAADWAQRRAAIVRAMQEVTGPLPGSEKRCALDVRIEEEADGGDHVRRLISYQSEPGSRTPAYLLIPKAALAATPARTFPGVLCLHPTEMELGHKVVAGLGGRKDRAYAVALSRRGFVAIAPAYPLMAKYQPDLEALGYRSGTMKAIWDNVRALDVLEAFPAVQRGRFSAIGHSLGGHNAIFTAVFDERIAAVVSSCGFDSFSDYFAGQPAVWRPGQGWTQPRYMPRLAEYAGRLAEIPFDFHELLAALAPRRVFVSAPRRDTNFRHESAARAVGAARRVYDLFGAAGRLEVRHPDRGHDFPEELQEAAFQAIEEAIR